MAGLPLSVHSNKLLPRSLTPTVSKRSQRHTPKSRQRTCDTLVAAAEQKKRSGPPKPKRRTSSARRDRQPSTNSRFRKPSGSSWSTTKKGRPGSSKFDRFIPHRDAHSADRAHDIFALSGPPSSAMAIDQKDNTPRKPRAGSSQANSANLRMAALLTGRTAGDRVLMSSTPRPAARAKDRSYSDHHIAHVRRYFAHNRKKQQQIRFIPLSSERVLDAPGLLNDFYLNVMNWSRDGVLGIALTNYVYLWTETSGCTELCCLDQSSFWASLRWKSSGGHMALGVDDGSVELWDTQHKQKVADFTGHLNVGRVGSLGWNGPVLSVGGSNIIINYDTRSGKRTSTLCGHQQEVCGLEWDCNARVNGGTSDAFSTSSYLASGANDNRSCVWDLRRPDAPLRIFDQHNAAVKALAWDPFARGVLATGAGTADRHMRIFDVKSGELLKAVDTGSQVVSLVWSRNRQQREIVSAHGFSENQLTVWSYPTLRKLVDLKGHTDRVLQASQSPDGTTVVSAAADESLRFWRIWDPAPAENGQRGGGNRLNTPSTPIGTFGTFCADVR